MTSVVHICNMALGRFRGKKITELTDDTVEANACHTYYEAARDFVLADFPWNFAGKSIVLAQLAEVPEEWAFAYTYPDDCLKVRRLHPESKLRHWQDSIPYEVSLGAEGGKVIFTNLYQARCRYTQRLENVNHFDPHFVTALSWYLASEIAIPVAGVSKGRLLADRALQGYQASIYNAIAANANEEDVGEPRYPETIRAYQ